MLRAVRPRSFGAPPRVLRSLLAATLLSVPVAATPAAPGDVVDALRQRVDALLAFGRLAVGDQAIDAVAALPRLYEHRGFAPVWSDPDGPLPIAREALAWLRSADREGLAPTDYHTAALGLRLAGLDPRATASERAELDLLLTDACLVYASHLLAGKVSPTTIDPEWQVQRREGDVVELLEDGLAAGHVAALFRRLLPAHPGYAALRRALADLRARAASGGWPVLPEGPALHPGDLDPRVAALRQRLLPAVAGESPPSAEPQRYDPELAERVRALQRRLGLDPDGVVGAKTAAALNTPLAERIDQLRANLERWRWLPQELGERYLLLNIADFELRLVEAGRVVLQMRAVVGRTYRRTPVLSDRLTYLVLNPTWNVPPQLARLDILPHARQDPTYLSRLGFRVYRSWEAGAEEVDPATVDWSAVPAAPLPFVFRQRPGPSNSLGRIKFMFPNPFNVYLHDTPERRLFGETRRAYSSGCIRIEKPVELAEYLLRDDPAWSPAKLRAALDAGVERTVPLARPIPIHLLYWTAWVDDDGALQLRDDIYARDARLLAALDAPPPQDGVPVPEAGLSGGG